MSTTPGPTERQPKETAPAYQAFRTYLEQGPRRSTAAVARALGKSKTLIDRWSSRWRWVERVRAFDSQAGAVADRATLEAIAKRSKRQAEIAQLHGEVTAYVAGEVVRRTQDDPAWLRTLGADELLRVEAAMARAHNRVVITERLALGISTDNPSAADTPRTAAEEAARRLTDEELAAKLSGVDELAEQRRKKKAAARRTAGG